MIRGLALLCAVTVWLLGLLAASPELHAMLHADSDHCDHECAVTLFAQGAEGSTTGPVLTVGPMAEAPEQLPAPTEWQGDSITTRLQPSQGPPAR